MGHTRVSKNVDVTATDGDNSEQQSTVVAADSQRPTTTAATSILLSSESRKMQAVSERRPSKNRKKYQAESSVTMPSSEDLYHIYMDLVETDVGCKKEALSAYQEMQDVNIPLGDDSIQVSYLKKLQGTVDRRAPLHMLTSTRLGKYKQQQRSTSDVRMKMPDPALKNNPLTGRLVLTIGSTATIFMVFVQSLIVNKHLFNKFHADYKTNIMFGPRPETLLYLGGLNMNKIRNSSEVFRIFWSMWMHAGWIHLGLNVLCQLQYLIILEPDYGFIRVFILFWISGVTGNLFSAILNPCSTTVGSSGALFGLMAAMIPYAIEYWTTIPRPGCLLSFSCVVAIVSLLSGFTPTTDNWAHIGGFIGGFLFGLGTISTLGACRACSEKNKVVSKKISDVRRKTFVKKETLNQLLHRKRFIPAQWHCGKREWIVRILCFSSLILIWTVSWLFIYDWYEYQPLGQVTYQGIRQCCCSYDQTQKRVFENWKCETSPSPHFDDCISIDLLKLKSSKLKKELSDLSLVEALGLKHDHKTKGKIGQLPTQLVRLSSITEKLDSVRSFNFSDYFEDELLEQERIYLKRLIKKPYPQTQFLD